jgi:hypothetical protein
MPEFTGARVYVYYNESYTHLNFIVVSDLEETRYLSFDVVPTQNGLEPYKVYQGQMLNLSLQKKQLVTQTSQSADIHFAIHREAEQPLQPKAQSYQIKFSTAKESRYLQLNSQDLEVLQSFRQRNEFPLLECVLTTTAELAKTKQKLKLTAHEAQFKNFFQAVSQYTQRALDQAEKLKSLFEQNQAALPAIGKALGQNHQENAFQLCEQLTTKIFQQVRDAYASNLVCEKSQYYLRQLCSLAVTVALTCDSDLGFATYMQFVELDESLQLNWDIFTERLALENRADETSSQSQLIPSTIRNHNLLYKNSEPFNQKLLADELGRSLGFCAISKHQKIAQFKKSVGDDYDDETFMSQTATLQSKRIEQTASSIQRFNDFERALIQIREILQFSIGITEACQAVKFLHKTKNHALKTFRI